MAVMKLETLVLGGVSIARDVVTGLKGIGSNPAKSGLPAMDLSHSRHLSQSYRQAEADDPQRPWRADRVGAARAARRAGRPGSFPGVSVRRTPAIVAGRTVLSGWSLRKGAFSPMAMQCYDTAAPADRELPKRFQPPATRTLGSSPRRLVGTAWFRPSGTLPASTRG
jgi:hypothetical protein